MDDSERESPDHATGTAFQYIRGHQYANEVRLLTSLLRRPGHLNNGAEVSPDCGHLYSVETMIYMNMQSRSKQ